MDKTKNIYGLLGKELTHSFSPKFFFNKFKKENIYAEYNIFPLSKISDFNKLLIENSSIKGLNITIPYKEKIIRFLDEIDKTAFEINAVNTIKFKENKLIGYNTDVIGFEKSFKPFLKKYHKKALVFGNGGAAKAVFHVLEKLKIPFVKISRNKTSLKYSDVDKQLLKDFTILINTTPLGMFPKTETKVNIEYNGITNKHLVYDLVYNPLETAFLKEAKKNGATTKNGLEMLEIQAEESWKIWNK